MILRNLWMAAGLLALVLVQPAMIEAAGRGGFGGGGGGGRPSGGGGGRPGGGARPAPRPSAGHMGGARPSPSRPSASRPAPSRPTPSRPSPSRPSPSIARPSGGMKPSTRPATPNRPSVATRPSLPTASRPGGGSGSIPSVVGRPSTRPGGSIGGPSTRPAPRPGDIGGKTRPSPGRPGIPDIGSTRPSRPTPPGVGGTRPGARPSPGDLGDFLGIQKPVRPGGPGGAVTLPGRPGDRPGIADRPGIGERPTPLPGRPGGRPGGPGDRPIGGNRPERPTKPWNPGDRPNIGDNNGIHNRPGWVDIDNDRITNIINNWNTIINNNQNNWTRPADRWDHWGDNVHDNWHHHHHHDHWFDHDWWDGHYHHCGGWHYWHNFQNHGWNYWWTVPVWGGLNTWFNWTPAWSQPVYYDYGTGGNVVYQDNSVYIGGQQIATADEFAESAATLATVAPPASDDEAAKAEWMPLGTFAISTDEKDTDPSRIIQLAVNKEGIIAGTIYNIETDEAVTVQGRVDKQTQRVAFRIGDSDTVVAETGLYNLTQDKAPVLVHFGKDKTETYLLVRLQQPEAADAAAPPQDE